MAYAERIIVVGSGQVGVAAATRVAHRFGRVDLIGDEVAESDLGEIGVRVYRDVTVKSVDLDTPALIVDKDGGRIQRLVCDRLVLADAAPGVLPEGKWAYDGKVVQIDDEHDLGVLDDCFETTAGWRNALAAYQWRRQADAGQLA